MSTFSVCCIGKPFNAHVINKAVSNIIAFLVFGERFEFTDKQFESILQHISEIVLLQGSIWAQVSHLCSDSVLSHLFNMKIYPATLH